MTAVRKNATLGNRSRAAFAPFPEDGVKHSAVNISQRFSVICFAFKMNKVCAVQREALVRNRERYLKKLINDICPHELREAFLLPVALSFVPLSFENISQ